MTHRPIHVEPASGDYREWQARRRISEEEIFAALIRNEVREGPLTRARRRRLVRYAAHLKLSAVDVGRMIASCRADVAPAAATTPPPPALRLIQPIPRKATGWRIAGLVALATVMDVLILWWVL